MNIFFENLKEIEAHNAKKLSWTKGVNNFADLTKAEFNALYLGYLPKKSSRSMKNNKVQKLSAQKRETVDWISTAVLPVQDQGACGSCWAFSSVGSIEGSYATRKTSPLKVKLSEQQLVSCSSDFGNFGCDGGLMTNSFEYLIELDEGLDLQSEYPYVSGNGKEPNCKSKESRKGAYKIGGYIQVVNNDCDDLYNAINVQPVSVAVDASGWSFYSGGVYVEQEDNINLNHGVTLVGYNADSNEEYWIVKNSWGTGWGGPNKGYIYLQAKQDQGTNAAGTSGICQDASYTYL